MRNNRNRFGRSGKSGIAGRYTSPTMQKIHQQGSLYTRGQVLRGFGLGAAGVAAAGLLGSGVARAAPGDTNPDPDNIDGNPNNLVITVYPTGISGTDVTNVQWAVDNVTSGGTVLLKAGTFNFGETGHIKLEKDVHIVGEVDGEGNLLSEIRGGRSVFRAGAEGEVDGDVNLDYKSNHLYPVHFSVENIHFVGFTYIAIAAYHAKGFMVKGCKFSEPMELFPHQMYPYPICIGVLAGNIPPHYTNDPREIEGNVEILNNNFDGNLTHGIFLFYGVNAVATISNNEMVGAMAATIVSYNKNITKISYNNIKTSRVSRWSNSGIVVGDSVSTIVCHNEIECRSNGIYTEQGTRNLTFKDNFITTRADHAISLNGAYGCTVEYNEIVVEPLGEARNGFRVYRNASGNIIRNNDLSGFSANVAQVNIALGSNGNTFTGNVFGNSDGYGVYCQGSTNTFEHNTIQSSALASVMLAKNKAIGSISALAGISIDGLTFWISDDGTETNKVTFEFVKPNGDTNNVRIEILGTETAAEIAIKMRDAINKINKEHLLVTAGGTGSTVSLTHDVFGPLGNNATYTTLVSTKTLSFTGGSEPIENEFSHNNFIQLSPPTLALYFDNGIQNICNHNDFSQCNVPGWSPDTVGCIYLAPPLSLPLETALLLLDSGSSNAQIYQHPKLGTKLFPTGTSMCNQIADLGVNNYIHQWENFCNNPPNKNLQDIRDRWAAHEQWMQEYLDEPPPEMKWPEYWGSEE